MTAQVRDIFNDLSYYSLFDVAEKARWLMRDVDWEHIDKSMVTPALIEMVKTITFGELTTYSATRSFMEMFEDDIDFTQWLAVWLYEETKHPHALTKWLAMNGVQLSGQYLMEGRTITPMTKSRTEMLTFNVISEIVAGNMYLATSESVSEPVLKDITAKLAKDEMRHSVGFENYTRRTIAEAADPDYEKTIVLRSAWVFLQGDQFINHPVFETVRNLNAILGDTVIKKIRKQIVSRIGKLAGVDIPEPEQIYAVYSQFKADYRAKRKTTPSKHADMAAAAAM
ncbi:ferritin-like domain-containing protein [Dyella silvatica]|uniref:ferritin-like domain-containing protein n=1 Tax=Dyella silvatica TaxID=2992128 RepID=UPI00225B0BA8|nr:ferritin-like domain-containing protein [Dyella silvatica]